jgi:hypothetical protein
MTTIAFSVLLVGGDRADVTYEGPDHADADRVIEHVVSTLARDSGAVHCRRDSRLVVLFGRGVAAVEITEPASVKSSADRAA